MLRKKLNQELADLRAANEAIFAAAATGGEGGVTREMTAEEQATVEANLQRKAAIDRQIALLDADRDAGWPEAEQRSNAANVQVGKTHAEDKPWAHFGEFMQAVAQASTPGGSVDVRLAKDRADANGFRAAASGGNMGNGADGGFLVRTQFSDALLDRAREENPILGMCRSMPLEEGFNELDLPVIDETSRATGSRYGGVQVYRAAEAATVTATKPAFGKLKITTSKIMGIAYATDEILRNARAMDSLYGDAFSSEIGFKVVNEIFRGAGGDECLGFIGGPATVSQAKESGQAADSIVTKNLSKMWMHLPARLKAGSVWVINNEVEPELDELTVPAGTGAVEPRIVTYGPDGALRIKGRPILVAEQASALGDVGDISLCNFNEYIVSPRGSIEQQESMHVRFIYGEMTFRWTYYINGKPAWLSTVTPFKGSAEIAPFVTLAERA